MLVLVVCSLPEILLLCDIKERVEVEHVEADLVQGLEQEGLGQLQLVKPSAKYHCIQIKKNMRIEDTVPNIN